MLNFVDPSGYRVVRVYCKATSKADYCFYPEPIIKIVAMPPATNANVCPKGYELKNIDPLRGDAATAAGLCAAMAAPAASCGGCTVAACESAMALLLQAIRDTWLLNIFGRPIGTNTCQRWVFQLEQRLPPAFGLQNSCIKNAEVLTYKVGYFTNHVVYKMTLCDGSAVYADNGAWGGDDHIFFVLPPNAKQL